MDSNLSEDQFSRICSVELFRREGDGSYSVSKAIQVQTAEQNPIESSDAGLFRGISYDVERCVWTLWVATFRVPFDLFFRRRDLVIESQWVIRDSTNMHWSIQQPKKEMAGTQWRCPAIEIVGGVPGLNEGQR